MTLLSYEEALAAILRATSPLPATDVPVQSAAERVLAEDVRAAWSLPRDPVSIMDGYALRASDLASETSTVQLRIAGQSAAGRPLLADVPPGHAVRISTGAVVPPGCDIVVPQEDTRAEADRVEVDLATFGPVEVGRFIRAAGSDVEQGALVIAAGTWLGPGDLAAAAAAGSLRLAVHRRPAVAVLGTGDELAPIGGTPGPGGIIGTNTMMLGVQVRRAGGVAHLHEAAPDDRHRLRVALQRASALADVIVTTGGASVGDHDLVRDAWSSLGCAFDFHGLALRPGKPTAYGRLGGKHVFVLPGNPASAMVTFELFVRPAVRSLLGLRGDLSGARVRVELRNAAPGAGSRTHFVRARLHADGTATTLGDQISGNLRSISDFDALVVVPAGVPELTPGSVARAVVVEPWWHERRSPSA